MAGRDIGIGILGAGSMGGAHAASYRGIEGVALRGIWSRSRERASGLARAFATTVATDPAALLANPAIDVIDVCVPSAVHRDHVVAACAAGKHVICETPFALEMAEAQAMIAAAQEAGRLLFVGLLMRSVAEYVHLREQALSGALGRLVSLSLYRLGSYLRAGAADARPHYGDPSTEVMTFDFDFLSWLMGKPARLSAIAALSEAGTPGEITALLSYPGGVSAVVTGSGLMPKGFAYRTGFRAVFERGAYELATVFDGPVPSSTYLFHPEGRAGGPVALARYNPYERELGHCIDCIRAGAPSPLLGAEHAVAALELSLATQRSWRHGETIEFGAGR